MPYVDPHSVVIVQLDLFALLLPDLVFMNMSRKKQEKKKKEKTKLDD